MSNNTPPEKHFYKVAFSYASENREYVIEVYECLVSLVEENAFCRKEDIFFDVPSFNHGIVRAEKPLKTIYSEQAAFIVPFHCKNYKNKKWTKIEHREIEFLLDNQESDCIIPVRFDETKIDGFEKFTTTYIEAKNNKAKKVAEQIFKRLQHPTYRSKQLFLQEKWGAIGVNYSSIHTFFQSVDEIILRNNEEILRQKEIRKICSQIISPEHLDHFPMQDEMSYTTTLNWFAEREGYKYLLKYVHLFLKKITIEEETFEKIENWLEDCCSMRQLNIKRQDLEPQKTKEKETGKIHLLIEFIETDEANLYITKLFKSDENEQIRRLITPETLEEVNIKNTDSKKIFTETFFEFLGELELEQQAIDIELEFIVPYHLLWCDFEQWINENGECLGHHYPVLVRPELALRRQKKQYLSRWKTIKKTCLLKKQIKYLNQEIKPELKKWQAELNKFITQVKTDIKCSTVAIGSPLKPGCSSLKQFIQRGGLPIIIWARKNSKEGVSKEFLTKNNLSNKMLTELPTAIRDMRLQGMTEHQKDLKNNLVLLIDDKERQPPRQQLQSPYSGE